MKKILYPFIVAVSLFILLSCSGDDEPATSDIVGSWYGTRTYYNPVGGTKYQYLTVSFDSNGTGNMEYESPVSYSVAKFIWRIKGNSISCKGAYVDTYGEIDDDFSMNLTIRGDRLIPDDKFSYFILTRDNSVMTDGDGNEIID